MRITEEERGIIKAIIRKSHPNAKIYLFGSRTNDQALGGDIDLLILDHDILSLEEKQDILVDLNTEIGEQKYDLLSYTHTENNAFKVHILNQAILL